MSAPTLNDLIRLSPQERLALIGELWDSLSETEVPLTAAQTAELEHRLARFEQDRAGSMTWEQLEQELKQRRV